MGLEVKESKFHRVLAELGFSDQTGIKDLFAFALKLSAHIVQPIRILRAGSCERNEFKLAMNNAFGSEKEKKSS